MKKFLTVSAAIVLAMSLVACGSDKKADKQDTTATTVVTETTAESAETTAASAETTTQAASSGKESTTAQATTQATTQAAAQETTAATTAEQKGEMLSQEDADKALTNFIHARYGADFGDGTNTYWFVGPLTDGNYTGELHSYTGAITYFYIDPYLGKTDICEKQDATADPVYVETVNFWDYK